MKRHLNTIGQLLLTSAIVFVVCWQSTILAWSQTTETDMGQIERGKDLVEEHCSQCHAVGIDDFSKHPASIAFRELSARYPTGFLGEALAEGILTGHPEMPVFGLYPNEIDQIVVYIESLRDN